MSIQKSLRKDFLFGAIFANGFIWIWFKSSNYTFPENQFLSSITYIILTYFLYFWSGLMASFFIFKKNVGSVKKGFIFGVTAWIGNVLLMPLFFNKLIFEFLVITLICFVLGGICGVYLVDVSQKQKNENNSENINGQ